MLEWLGVRKKDSYTPSQTKRYEVSKDEFSTKRIRALRDIHHELEEVLEIPLSLSIIGSLVKGKVLTPETTERADIDVFLDVDIDTLPQLKKPVEYLQTVLIVNLQKKASQLGYEEIPTEHLKVRVINHRTIHEAVNKYMDSTYLRGRKNAEIFLSSFFTLSIGSVVKKYRNQFLSELSQMEDQTKARLIWQTIIRVLEKTERKGEIPEQIKKQFPQTLEEALKFYGVK